MPSSSTRVRGENRKMSGSVRGICSALQACRFVLCLAPAVLLMSSGSNVGQTEEQQRTEVGGASHSCPAASSSAQS